MLSSYQGVLITTLAVPIWYFVSRLESEYDRAVIALKHTKTKCKKDPKGY